MTVLDTKNFKNPWVIKIQKNTWGERKKTNGKSENAFAKVQITKSC